MNWLAIALYGRELDRRTFVRECAEGKLPAGLPTSVAAALVRYAPIAEVVGEFQRELLEGRVTPYSPEAIRRTEQLDAASAA